MSRKILVRNPNCFTIKSEMYTVEMVWNLEVIIKCFFNEDFLDDLEDSDLIIRSFDSFVYEKIGVDDVEYLYEVNPNKFQELVDEFYDKYDEVTIEIDKEYVEEILKEEIKKLKGLNKNTKIKIRTDYEEVYVEKNKIDELEKFINNY